MKFSQAKKRLARRALSAVALVAGFYLAFSVLAASLVLLFYKFCAALGRETLTGVAEGIALPNSSGSGSKD